MEDNKFDKHGNIKLKTLEGSSSRDNTNPNSMNITPRRKLDKNSLHLRIEDVIDTKEAVPHIQDKRIEHIGYLQQLHKQQNDHKESALREYISSTSPKRPSQRRRTSNASSKSQSPSILKIQKDRSEQSQSQLNGESKSELKRSWRLKETISGERE